MRKAFTTETQRHRGKPRKIGRREVRSGAVVPGVVHSGGGGDREHREHGDHVCVASVGSVPQCLCEPGCKVELVPASEYEFSKGSTKPEPTQTTSPITLCSLSPPPPLCTTPTTKAQNHTSRRPIFLGFPLCLCVSVVNIVFLIPPEPSPPPRACRRLPRPLPRAHR